jgi:hypothetical protein
MENIAALIIYNLVDTNDPQGRTIKEVNLDETHAIPIGTLVEIDLDYNESHGVRAFIIAHTRDCDGSPLYSIDIDNSH